MNRQKITIQVDSEAAELYHSSSEEEKRKLSALLGSRLREISRRRDRGTPLEEVMSEIGQKAQKRGLTPEKLDDILNEQ